MAGEIKTFRKKLFGGFDPRDVADYIALLARERNSYLKAKDDAEYELLELRRELAEVRSEAAERASDALSGLEREYENVRADVTAAGGNMRAELLQIDDAIALLSSAITRAKGQLCEFSAVGAGSESRDADGGEEAAGVSISDGKKSDLAG